MDAATRIRDCVARVAQLRTQQSADPAQLAALKAVKRLQSRRFEATYADMLADPRFSTASQFFLNELYGDKDYAQRDAQFTRIAGALQRLFSAHVVRTATDMAGLHLLTEELDDAMATQWRITDTGTSDAARYVEAWNAVGRPADRTAQLRSVLALGRDLDALTHTLGLRSTLRLMRKPAAAAGLGALQAFLERGFDAFSAMGDATVFLSAVEARETRMLAQLFDADRVASATNLQQVLALRSDHLGQAR